MDFNLNIFKKIIEMQNEINRTVRDEVDCNPGVEQVKIDLETLTYGLLNELLDEMNLCEYIESYDFDGDKLVLELNTVKVESYHEALNAEAKAERDELMKWYFKTRGIE